MTENSSAAQSAAGSSGAVLSIRLWIKGTGAPAEEASRQGPPSAAALALDLIAASGGAEVTTDGGMVVSQFPSVQSAVLAARRVQWAISGYSELASDPTPGAAMLVQSPDDRVAQPSPEALPPQLEQASPGQILITHALSQQLTNLPGISLMPASQDGLSTLEWRPSKTPASLAADEALLQQLIQERGVEDPGASQPEAASVRAEIASPTVPETASISKTPEPATSAAKAPLAVKPWQIAAAGATALVIVVALVIAFRPAHRGDASQTPTPQATPSAAQAAPSNKSNPQPTAQSRPSPSPQPNIPAKKKERDKSAPPAEVDSHSSPATKGAMGTCNLNASEVPAALDEAWATLQNGHYADSERKFRTVLACEPANPRALKGYERARSGRELQQSSPKP